MNRGALESAHPCCITTLGIALVPDIQHGTYCPETPHFTNAHLNHTIMFKLYLQSFLLVQKHNSSIPQHISINLALCLDCAILFDF